MRPQTSPIQCLASVLLLTTGGTHVPLIREHLEEAPYVGWLFVTLAVVCLALAVLIVVIDDRRLWAIAGLTCLAAAVAFLASRTVGLPQIGDDVGNWTDPFSFPAVAAEAVMAMVAYTHLGSRRRLSPNAA
jgi:hypothetical protein